MPKVTINVKAHSAPGEQESHYGYLCTVGPERQLFADVPDDLIQIELEHGRVALVHEEAKGPKLLEDMKAGELIAYASENGLDIGGLVPQAGKEKILAAVKEALTKKEQV